MSAEQAWQVLRAHATAEPGQAAWVSAPTLLRQARAATAPFIDRDVQRAAKVLELT